MTRKDSNSDEDLKDKCKAFKCHFSIEYDFKEVYKSVILHNCNVKDKATHKIIRR